MAYGLVARALAIVGALAVDAMLVVQEVSPLALELLEARRGGVHPIRRVGFLRRFRFRHQPLRAIALAPTHARAPDRAEECTPPTAGVERSAGTGASGRRLRKAYLWRRAVRAHGLR